ncbi:hypothetical protein BDW22DRAFT_1432997 [Trametopsis cervina]|nr:hypothetical protein BDW22DRAFT_1432997 [Trametopsis cervina]
MSSDPIQALTACGLTESSARTLLATHGDASKAAANPIQYLDAAWSAEHAEDEHVRTAQDARAALINLGLREDVVNDVIRDDEVVQRGPNRAPVTLGVMLAHGLYYRE